MKILRTICNFIEVNSFISSTHFVLSILQNIDDNALLREIDFRDFESKFQLPVKIESKKTKDKRQRIFSMGSNLIRFVDLTRARNMSKLTKLMS